MATAPGPVDFPNPLMSAALTEPGDAPGDVIPVHVLTSENCEAALDELDAARWAKAHGFTAKTGQVLSVPGDSRTIAAVLFGAGEGLSEQPFLPGKLASALPSGTYALVEERFADNRQAELAVLGFLLSSYQFQRYRQAPSGTANDGGETDDTAPKVRLVCPASQDRAALLRTAQGVALTRDLVNTPANDMGPADLEAAAHLLAGHHNAALAVTTGEDLLEAGFPMIHAVGRASDDAPRLIDLRWGDKAHAKLTLVGKGVIFDTGGLDLKPSQAMRLMKKDMGGAANVLGLAHMIMDAGLPVRLRVLIPAVENAVSGSAFRPGDILASRKGISVEIGNTDAEGRLVLADALTLACEEDPDLLIDMATLTGAARVALGTDLPALFTNDDTLATHLVEAGNENNDPVWRLPLHKPYVKLLDSKVADTNNISSGGFAGAITAALFLEKFVEEGTSWIHLDVFSWSNTSAPGKVEGGEAQAIRALFGLLAARYRS
jgi:leucyl aminopeptidase